MGAPAAAEAGGGGGVGGSAARRASQRPCWWRSSRMRASSQRRRHSVPRRAVFHAALRLAPPAPALPPAFTHPLCSDTRSDTLPAACRSLGTAPESGARPAEWSPYNIQVHGLTCLDLSVARTLCPLHAHSARPKYEATFARRAGGHAGARSRAQHRCTTTLLGTTSKAQQSTAAPCTARAARLHPLRRTRQRPTATPPRPRPGAPPNARRRRCRRRPARAPPARPHPSQRSCCSPRRHRCAGPAAQEGTAVTRCAAAVTQPRAHHGNTFQPTLAIPKLLRQPPTALPLSAVGCASR